MKFIAFILSFMASQAFAVGPVIWGPTGSYDLSPRLGVGTRAPISILNLRSATANLDGYLVQSLVGLTHGMTDYFPTDVYAIYGPFSNNGGLYVNSASSNSNPGMSLFGIQGTGSPTNASFEIYGAKKSGTTSDVVGAAEILFGIGNNAPPYQFVQMGNGRVGIGTITPGQMLTVAGTIESTAGGFKFPDATVQTTAGAAAPAIGGPLSGVTTGSVLFGGGGNFAQDNSKLFWDDTNFRLGIGTASPTAALDVRSGANFVQLVPAAVPAINFNGTIGTSLSAKFAHNGNTLEAADNLNAVGAVEATGGGLISGPLNYSAAPVGTLTLFNSTGSTYTYLANNGGGNGVAYGLPSASPDFVVRTNAYDMASGTEQFRIKDNGSVIIADTGGHTGNVPHGCTTVTGAAGTASVSCAANAVATGGGADCGNTALFLSKSVPTGGPPSTGWQGSCTSLLNVVTNATIVVSALCCQY